MFTKNLIDEKLDAEIVTVLELMEKETDATSENYKKLVERLTALHAIREKNRVSKDAIVNIAANLIGIVIILNHESTHVIATKAFGLVKKIF